jgi:uncharacterized protein
MQSVIVALDERLENPGDTRVVADHLDEKSYSLGEREFTLPEGIDYDLVLTNAGEGILATGIISCHVKGSCDRCLGDAEFDVKGEVDEYFLFKEPEQKLEVGDGEDEVDYALVSSDHTVDLTDALESALLMDTPFIVLCQEDCRGLCPVCGQNLNESDCGHGAQIEAAREQERLDRSPFAVLKDLKLDE